MAVWGGDGVAELAKEISRQVKTLKKPAIKGGAVDGIVIGAEQVEEITKLPSREALIGRVVSLALAPAQRVVALANAPASGLLGQLKTLAEGAPAEGDDPEAEATAGAAAAPAAESLTGRSRGRPAAALPNHEDNRLEHLTLGAGNARTRNLPQG